MKQKHNIYGLTGGSGSGKSSAAKILNELGFFVIDADITAREILNHEALEELRGAFGDNIINESGSLNRKALAKIVFNDTEKLDLLNSITHPKIAKSIIKTIDNVKNENVVIDAAVLLKCRELMDICDKIIIVTAKKDVRIHRIMQRDHLSYDEALSRINAQMSDSDLRKVADIIWENNGEIDDLRRTISGCFG